VLFLLKHSFNCKKATTSIEKHICSDKEVSTLDDKLAKVYKRVLHFSIKNKLSKCEGSSNYMFFK